MTLEQILGMSAEGLEALSDKELEDFFTPYFKVTRPELIEKKTKSVSKVLRASDNTSTDGPIKRTSASNGKRANKKDRLARILAKAERVGITLETTELGL